MGERWDSPFGSAMKRLTASRSCTFRSHERMASSNSPSLRPYSSWRRAIARTYWSTVSASTVFVCEEIRYLKVKQNRCETNVVDISATAFSAASVRIRHCESGSPASKICFAFGCAMLWCVIYLQAEKFVKKYDGAVCGVPTCVAARHCMDTGDGHST